MFTFLLAWRFYWHIRLKSAAYFFDSPCTLHWWTPGWTTGAACWPAFRLTWGVATSRSWTRRRPRNWCSHQAAVVAGSWTNSVQTGCSGVQGSTRRCTTLPRSADPTCLVDEHSVPRMPNRLVVPPLKLSTVGSRAFAAAASHIWNTLPTDVVAASSLSTFRRLVNLSYSSCHILTSSTDIIQLVVLAVVAPLRSLIDWLIDWLTVLTAAKQGRLVLGWCSNAVRLFANGSSPEVHVSWTSFYDDIQLTVNNARPILCQFVCDSDETAATHNSSTPECGRI